MEAVDKHLKKLPAALKILAIGSATAQVVKDLGWKVERLLSSFDLEKLKGQKVLYPRSSIGREEWVETLRQSGAAVDVVEAYQTTGTQLPYSTCYHMVMKVDAILFFSPSAVKAFADQKVPGTFLYVPFGPTTAKALEENGFKPAFVPSQPNEDVLVQALLKFIKSRG